mmetsp:Transcript_7635/g.21729  ORF Transcript_7635/g.21729 Transcript_7635/m.21729 type:complete len:80 (-) Transcript_7635:875-1114(-)
MDTFAAAFWVSTMPPASRGRERRQGGRRSAEGRGTSAQTPFHFRRDSENSSKAARGGRYNVSLPEPRRLGLTMVDFVGR